MSRGDFKRELKACDMLERAVLEALKDKNQFKRIDIRIGKTGKRHRYRRAAF